MKIEIPEHVTSAARRVESAYQQLLAASDSLAEAIRFDADYVLRRILPVKPEERRDVGRFMKWFESESERIVIHLESHAKVIAEQTRREELLRKLDLSADDKRILGIREY